MKDSKEEPLLEPRVFSWRSVYDYLEGSAVPLNPAEVYRDQLAFAGNFVSNPPKTTLEYQALPFFAEVQQIFTASDEGADIKKLACKGFYMDQSSPN